MSSRTVFFLAAGNKLTEDGLHLQKVGYVYLVTSSGLTQVTQYHKTLLLLHFILSPRADTRLAGVLLEACSQVYKFLIEGDL